MNRRSLLMGLGIVPVVACSSTGKKDTAAGDPENAEYLFVLSARAAMLREGVLTLDGVAPSAIFFTDRPQRIAGHAETAHLIEALEEDKQPDSFTNDPPNAVLSVLDGEYAEEVTVTLGKLEQHGDRIVCSVTVLDGSPSLVGGPASLFIDPIGRPRSPGSVAGVHRRERRRVRRRVVIANS